MSKKNRSKNNTSTETIEDRLLFKDVLVLYVILVYVMRMDMEQQKMFRKQ